MRSEENNHFIEGNPLRMISLNMSFNEVKGCYKGTRVSISSVSSRKLKKNAQQGLCLLGIELTEGMCLRLRGYQS